MTFSEELRKVFLSCGLTHLLTPAREQQFERLAAILAKKNKQFNLTAVTDEHGIIYQHFADSLTAASLIPDGAKVIDVGCGGGFPSLPLAIVRPDLRITGLDSTAKKIEYVKEAAQELGLSNLDAICARAEDAGHMHGRRESFDVAIARAVAELRVLSELCLPLVKPGGVFLAMKSRRAEEERADAESAITRLGGKIERFECFSIDDGEEKLERVNILVRKTRSCDATFPRPYPQILRRKL